MVWRSAMCMDRYKDFPPDSEGNATLFDCAMSLDTPTAIHGGLICSGDKFITDRSELNDIKEKFHEAAGSRYGIGSHRPNLLYI